MERTPSRVRAAGVLLVVTGLAIAVLALAVPVLASAPDALHAGSDVTADLVTAGAALLAAVAAARLWLVSVVVAGSLLRGVVPHPRGVLGALVLTACGVLSVGSLAAAAHAEVDRPAVNERQSAHGLPLQGLPLPDRALGGPAPVGGSAGFSPAGRARDRDQVRVRRGDALWTLARARLGEQAPDATVAQYVHRMHATNRAVIGPDPDLILPGQDLLLPHPPDHT